MPSPVGKMRFILNLAVTFQLFHCHNIPGSKGSSLKKRNELTLSPTNYLTCFELSVSIHTLSGAVTKDTVYSLSFTKDFHLLNSL